MSRTLVSGCLILTSLATSAVPGLAAQPGFSLAPERRWLGLGSGEGGTPPSLVVGATSDVAADLDAVFPGAWVESVGVGDLLFTRLGGPGHGWPAAQGLPALGGHAAAAPPGPPPTLTALVLHQAATLADAVRVQVQETDHRVCLSPVLHSTEL